MFFLKLLLQNEHRRSRRILMGGEDRRKLERRETCGYVRFRPTLVYVRVSINVEPSPFTCGKSVRFLFSALPCISPSHLSLQGYFNTGGTRRDERDVGGWEERSAEKNTLSSFTGAAHRRVRRDDEAEPELRSTINICRQWAAHISAASLPATGALLPSLFYLIEIVLGKRERGREREPPCAYVCERVCPCILEVRAHDPRATIASSLCRRCPPSPQYLGMCVSRHVCCLTYDASFHCSV